jgi:hypothetical protein
VLGDHQDAATAHVDRHGPLQRKEIRKEGGSERSVSVDSETLTGALREWVGCQRSRRDAVPGTREFQRVDAWKLASGYAQAPTAKARVGLIGFGLTGLGLIDVDQGPSKSTLKRL